MTATTAITVVTHAGDGHEALHPLILESRASEGAVSLVELIFDDCE
jgi:hypothetical protein